MDEESEAQSLINLPWANSWNRPWILFPRMDPVNKRGTWQAEQGTLEQLLKMPCKHLKQKEVLFLCALSQSHKQKTWFPCAVYHWFVMKQRLGGEDLVAGTVSPSVLEINVPEIHIWFEWEWLTWAHVFECLVTREYNCLKGFPAQYRGYAIKGLWPLFTLF